MNNQIKSFANTLAVAGIVVIVTFVIVFLFITFRSKQKAEEINYSLYSGEVDKKAGEIESIFRSIHLISKNFNYNLEREDGFLFHTNELDNLLNSYFTLENSIYGVWVVVEMNIVNPDPNKKNKFNSGKYWMNENGSSRLLDMKEYKPLSKHYSNLREKKKSQNLEFFQRQTPEGLRSVVRCTYLLKDSSGEPFGAFGIDVDLDKVISFLDVTENEMVDPFIYFIDGRGLILKHPDESFVGLYTADTLTNPILKDFFWQPESNRFYDVKSHQELFLYKNEINLMNGEDTWELGMHLPVSVARKDFIPIRNFMLLVGFFSFFLMGIFVIYSVFRWKREKDDRLVAEVLLNNSYAQLLSYMEGSEDVNIYSIDNNYRYLTYNSFHRQEMLSRFSNKPGKGINILDLLPENIRKIQKNYYDRALAGEQFMVTVDFDNGYYQQIFNPIYDNTNLVVGLTCNFIDITDKIVAQRELEQYREHLEDLVDERTKELRNQKEFLQMLIDQVPNQIFVRDKDSRYILVNKACSKAFGMSISEMIGKTILENHYDRQQAEVFMLEDKAILDDNVIVSYEDRLINKEGKDQWVIVNKTRVKLQDEYFVMGVFVDISYLKITENRLQEANQELNETISKLKNTQYKLIESEKMASLGQLMGGIAHEINNPINFVAGNVRPLMQDFEDIRNLLQEVKALEKETNEVTDIIEKYDVEFLINEMDALLNGISEGAMRIKDIVNNLKTFARPDDEDFKFSNLHEGLASTINLVKFKIRNRISIQTTYEDLPNIWCIPAKLNQVFLNLITNAIQSIEDTGQIFISTHLRNDNEVEIKITDSGAGIPKEIEGKIFNPFFTTKEVGTGTGLGLSLSFSIIKQHNGEISFANNKPKGTVFSIFLPVNAKVH